MKTFPLILLAVCLNAVAQLSLKAGSSKLGPLSVNIHNAVGVFWQAALNPMIFFSIMLYVISVGVWIIALSRVDVSYAYPMLSMGYVLNAVAAHYLFDESLSIMRLAGIFVIILGVFMISRTA